MATATEQSYSLEEFCRAVAQSRADGCLYGDDAQGRALLEVLWIKVALLRDVLKHAPNFSNLHVHTAVGGDHLPSAWAFRVIRTPATPTPVSPDGAAELARLWFGCLLANAQQDTDRIIAALGPALAAASDPAGRLRAVERLPQFAANNAIWRANSTALMVPPATLWSAILDIGVRLATMSPQDAPAVVSKAIADAANVAGQLRRLLFIDPPHMRRELTELLDELIADPQWLQSRRAPEPAAPVREVAARPAAATPAETGEDLDSTVILRRGTTSIPAAPPAPVSPAMAPPSQNLDETIIVSRGERVSPATTRPEPPPRPVVPAPESSDATIIISKRDTAPSEPADSMDETIILPKDKKR